MDNKDYIDEAIQQAGESRDMPPGIAKLETLRITSEKALKPMDFLFRLFGKPCFPRGELVAITGKAKSGKTFVTSMLMVCCVTQKVLALERNTDGTDNTDSKPLRVLWYDTEQSDESTQDILKNRVLPMIKTKEGTGDGLFDVFNVRAVEWKERRTLLGEAVTQYNPDLVVVDGIRDLVNDINDGVLAQEVMEELMKLATDKKCCIVCVLHQNKGSEDHNLRGWIGTELMNKAFEVYACEKMMPQRIFKIEQTLTRKYDIEQTMYFEVNTDGLPCNAVSMPMQGLQGRETDGNDFPQLNTDYIHRHDDGSWQVDVHRLFSDAIGGKQQVTGSDLRTQVCELCNIRSWKFYNSLLEKAVNESVILKSYDHASHVIYALKPQVPVQTELYPNDAPF